MESINNKAGTLFGDIMRFTLQTQKICFGLEAGPVHDATCIAYIIAPEIFETQNMNIVIDTNPGPCYGKTICDIINVSEKSTNCTVGLKINLSKFWDLIAESIEQYK